MIPPTFEAFPPIVQFAEYQKNGTYTAEVRLKNVSTISRRLRVFPLESDFFKSGITIFKDANGMLNIVANIDILHLRRLAL